MAALSISFPEKARKTLRQRPPTANATGYFGKKLTKIAGRVCESRYEVTQYQPANSSLAFSFSNLMEQARAKAAFFPCLAMDTEVFPCLPW